MTDYKEQIRRIKDKLLEAKEADKNLKVFGADRHQYIIHKPATLEQVHDFEHRYSLELPDCYKSFILQVGNGGTGWQNSAVGPFLGIYRFGENMDDLIHNNTENYLKEQCVIHPNMTDEHWRELTKNIENDSITDEDYEIESAKLFAGILPLGSQGCTYLHGLVLSGQFKGRVVNLDIDRQKPIFTPENNFLDWYERWLDEIIDGTLLQDGPIWFGYGIGGNSLELLRKYQGTKDTKGKKEILTAMLQKANIDSSVYEFLENEYSRDKTNYLLLNILTKFNYSKAKRYLLELSRIDFPNTVRTLRVYAPSKGDEWTDVITTHIEKITKDDTYLHIRKLLEQTGTDFAKIILPLLESEDANIRSSVINTLGNLKNKHAYLSSFMTGLEDSSKSVVAHAVYALYEAKDPALLPYYKKILTQLPAEKDSLEQSIERSIISNLKLFNLTKDELLAEDQAKSRKKWYEVWK